MLKLSLSLIMVIFTNNAYPCVMENKQDINADGIMDNICLLEPENKDNNNYIIKVCLSNDRCFINSTILEEIDIPTPAELSSLIRSSDDDNDNGFIIQTQDFQITVIYIKSNLFVTKAIGISRERPTFLVNNEPVIFGVSKEAFLRENFEELDFKKYKINLIPDKNDMKKLTKFKKENLKKYSTNDLLNLIYMGGIHDETIDNVDLILEHLQTRDDAGINSIRDLISQKKSLYPNRESKSKIKNKAFLYKHPKENKKPKMYLIKGDKITILDEETDDSGQKWYFINYKGKKDLNMWIKSEAVDVEPVQDPIEKPEPEAKQLTPKEPVETTKQAPVTTLPKNAEITKIEKPEPIEQSASGSISLTLLASLLGLLAWRVS